MPISNADISNKLPLLTDCEAFNAPVTNNLLFDVSVIAKCVAVPVPVTEASLIAAKVTLRPPPVLSAGEPILMLVVLPSV